MPSDVPHADELPDALTERDQWLCWRTQTRNGKPTKVPIDPHTRRFGSATDPDAWADFETAREAAADATADGLGFAFTDDDPLVGIDLDDCRDRDDGTLTDEATEIIEELVSYTEVSPSGTGVHVIVEGQLPGGRNRRDWVECYETARYFTVTGDHLDRTPIHRRRADARTRVGLRRLSPPRDGLGGVRRIDSEHGRLELTDRDGRLRVDTRGEPAERGDDRRDQLRFDRPGFGTAIPRRRGVDRSGPRRGERREVRAPLERRHQRLREPLRGRLADPTDIAEAVAFLADEETAGMITGEELRVDGGRGI